MAGNVIEELRNLYEEDQLILFVGAGVSMNSSAPSWNDLTNQFQDELYREEKEEIQNKKKVFEFYDHISTAQYLYNDNEDKYFKILEKTFSEQLKPNDLSRKIIDLNQSDIITTNYDTLLEESESYAVSQYEVIKNDEDLLNSVKQKKIIKMHGDVNHLKSIVLKEDDYLNYETQKKAMHNYLKHLFFSKTILFIGYGLGDYNVKQILNDIQNYSNQLTGGKNKRKHYFATYKSNDQNKKKNEDLLEQELERKNVVLVDVSEYETINYKSNLTNPIGKANYNFLCEIENYTRVKSLDESKIKEEVIKRFEQLNEQNYVSTNDILNILEIREKNIAASTGDMLLIDNKEIFNVLSSGKENILKVLNKTLLKKICYIENESCEKYTIPKAEENFKKIEIDLLENKVNRVYLEKELQLYLFGKSESGDRILKYYEEFDKKDNSFNDFKMQINTILITNVREMSRLHDTNKEEIKIENTLPIERKIKFIERSLNNEDKRRFNELKKIGNFEYSNHTNYYYKIIKKIKEEVKREGGIVSSRTDHFGELEKNVQSMYLSPMLNGVASLIYKGSFKQVINEYAIAYLSPFNRKYSNLKSRDDFFFGDYNKLFKDIKLTVIDIIFISDMIENNELVKIIKENDVDIVNINFEKEVLYEFFEGYCCALESLENGGLFKMHNNFVKNMLVFLALIDKAYLYRISKMNLPFDFISFYLKFHLKSIRVENLSLGIDENFYNFLFSEVFSNSDGEIDNQYSDFELLLRRNAELINEDNKLLLAKAFDNYENSTDISAWIIDFENLIGKDRVISKFEVSNLNCCSLLTLIANDYVPITDELLNIVKKKIIDYSSQEKDVWYSVILNFSSVTKYKYSRDIWNIVSDITVDCSRVVYNVIHHGSLVEINRKMTFQEVKLIKALLNDSELRKKINVEKINSELKEMEELSLTARAEYYLWGVVDMYRSNQLEN